MSHMCKRIFKFELQLSSYWQNIKFSWYCPKFSHFTNIVIFQIYLQLFRPTAPTNFMAGTCQEYSFSFCQLWAVNILLVGHANCHDMGKYSTFKDSDDVTKQDRWKKWMVRIPVFAYYHQKEFQWDKNWDYNMPHDISTDIYTR